jgi:hypothetical protein
MLLAVLEYILALSHTLDTDSTATAMIIAHTVTQCCS